MLTTRYRSWKICPVTTNVCDVSLILIETDGIFRGEVEIVSSSIGETYVRER